MNLYLVQHGKAQEDPDDSSRTLIEREREGAGKTVSSAARLCVLARIVILGMLL